MNARLNSTTTALRFPPSLPDLSHYTSGSAYCSRQEQLEQVLAVCNSNTTFVNVFTPGELGYPCIRIPSILIAKEAGNELIAWLESAALIAALFLVFWSVFIGAGQSLWLSALSVFPNSEIQKSEPKTQPRGRQQD